VLSEPPQSRGGPSSTPTTNGSNGAHTAAPRSTNRLRERMGSGSPSQREGVGGRVPAVQPASDNQRTSSADEASAHVLPQRSSTPLVISKNAQPLINEHQLDAPAIFAGTGLVREVDVIRHLESRAADHERAHPTPPSPATIAKAAPPEPRQAATTVNSAYST